MIGALLLTHLPQRQGSRFSNLVSHAGVHSAPNTPSNGPAVPSEKLPPQGRTFQNPDAADRLGFSSLRRETSGSVLGRCRTFLPVPHEAARCELQREGAKRRDSWCLLSLEIVPETGRQSGAPAYVKARR